MANPDAIFIQVGGEGQAIDPIVAPDGTVALKLAGTLIPVAGATDPGAPQLVEIYPPGPYVLTPTGLVLTQGAGTLGAGTYYYRVSATTGAGETLACAENSVVIAATTGVVLDWDAMPGATGYRIYGRATGAELFIAAVGGSILTYTDSGAITPTGALPTVNTARITTLAETDKAATGTLANVAGSASSVTLQAANTARKGLTIWNDSAAILYVKCAAAAASATSATVKLVADAYWECPFAYTGEVRGIWASATGSARLTEFS